MSPPLVLSIGPNEFTARCRFYGAGWSLLVAGLMALSLPACSAQVDDDADCGLVVSYGRQRYVPTGSEIVRNLPAEGSPIEGAAEVGCGESAVDAFALPGVPVEQAIRLRDTVLVNDPDNIPPRLSELFEPLACTNTGIFRVSGLFVDFDGGADPPKKVPYLVRIRDAHGSADPDTYRNATLSIRVMSETEPTLSSEDLVSLWEASELTFTVRCSDAGAFEALTAVYQRDRY